MEKGDTAYVKNSVDLKEKLDRLNIRADNMISFQVKRNDTVSEVDPIKLAIGVEYLAKMENIDVDMQTGSLDIDILKRDKPFAIICSEGKAKLKELPEHGETKIITQHCKVKRVRQDEGEEF